jgi:hypothetical protein
MPWLGFFHKAIISDQICILDNVQFATGDFINRNRVKTKDGANWLSIPVNKKGHLNRSIKDIVILDDTWISRHLSILKHNYSAANYFIEYIDEIENLFDSMRNMNLVEVNMTLIIFFFDILKIDTSIVYASDINVNKKKSDLILALCEELKADKYISGANGVNYLNSSDFENKKIQVIYQDYKHPKFEQLFGEFIPYLSIIDLVFNHGPKSRDILLRGNKIT